jgi:tetratricopeptide (TPR) repeat protein
MANGDSEDSLKDLIGYLKQAVQVLTTLAGLTGIFYALGFMIVNLRLLRLGLFETGLIRIGYVVPGVAFGLICLIIFVWTFLAFQFFRNLLKQRTIAVWLLSLLFSSGGAWFLAFSLWFWRGISIPALLWLNGVVIIMAVAPEIFELIQSKQQEKSSGTHPQPDPSMKAPIAMARIVSERAQRNEKGIVAAIYFMLAVIAISTYGYFVFAELPQVFGGGQPIVVRFYGENVKELEDIGISLEPGEDKLTERVELIAETSDRYVVHTGNRAIAFDKSFVQGLRSEPPEFFLDEAAFLEKHTQQGQRYLEDGAYRNALSEFNRALDRDDRHILALSGRAETHTALEDFQQAIEDYRKLIEVEQVNGNNYYALATTLVLSSDVAPESFSIGGVAGALETAIETDPELQVQIRSDPIFDPLRGIGGDFEPFDNAVYGSGPAAARWFRDRAIVLAEGGETDQAIEASNTAIAYAAAYSSHENALAPEEFVELYIGLKDLYLQLDRRDDAILTIDDAIGVGGLTAVEQADLYVALSEIHISESPHSSDAQEALQNAVLATTREDPTYLILLADLFRARGEPENAIRYYGDAELLATEDDPDRRQALIGQGRAYLESGNFERAIAAFLKTIEIPSPISDANLWYDFSLALAAGEDSRTQAALRIAIDIDLNLAEKALQDDWDDYFSKAGTSVENLITGTASFKLARELRNQGDLDGAILAYQEATDHDPGVIRYWQELGDTLTEAEQFAEAANSYEVALRPTEVPSYYPFRLPTTGGGGGEDPNLLTNLASAQLASGDPAGAVVAVAQAISLLGDSTPGSTYVLLAQAYEAQLDYELAAVAYEQASLVDVLNEEHAFHAGVNWLIAGQTNRGLELLDETITQGGLRIDATDVVGIRDQPSNTAQVISTLSIGANLQISGNPRVAEGAVWWPVVDREGNSGWIPALKVTPSTPLEVEVDAIGE